MRITTEEVCARARRQEKVSVWGHRVFLSAVALMLGACLYNLLRVRGPLLLFAEAWAFATLCYIVWGFWHGPIRMRPAESCLPFLRRELEGKIQGMRRLRRVAPLLVPAILAAWWGDGPLLGAKGWGISSPGLLKFVGGPGILIVMAVLLGLEWLLCSKAVRKFYRELEELRAQ